ncbi:hypothetical protein ACWDYJ_30200 [Streptomyces sp. NPDC003042]
MDDLSRRLTRRLTRLLVRLLARSAAKLFPDEPGPSRLDFVGLTCVIRMGRVDAGFGQAEVTAVDGSSALVAKPPRRGRRLRNHSPS